ncbi:hypothetical protein ES708_19122 [subsurface metagenome]
MQKARKEDESLWTIYHKPSDKTETIVATSVVAAYALLAWKPGDCEIREAKPLWSFLDQGKRVLCYKGTITVCPYQYAACELPNNFECPCRPDAPGWEEWEKQAISSHLCPYVGIELTLEQWNHKFKWAAVEGLLAETTPQ